MLRTTSIAAVLVLSATVAQADDIAPVSGYAQVNGLAMYYEVHGQGGTPLLLIHGGFGATGMFAPILPALAEGRQVVTVDLQGHGRTADIDRPLRCELMADDVAAVLDTLAISQADVMGYSLGGCVAMQTAIRHPDRVRKLVLVSTPFARAGWYPEVLAQMDQMNAQSAEMMKQSPIYAMYQQIAPRPEDWPVLVEKTADLLRQDYDWSAGVVEITAPTLLVFADADAVPPSHVAAFYGLLGGGQHDPGWDGANRPASELAIMPGTTHYDLFMAPLLPAVVVPFLDAPAGR